MATKTFNGVRYRDLFEFTTKADAVSAAKGLRKWKQVTAGKQQSTLARVVERRLHGKTRYIVYAGKTRTRTAGSYMD